MYELIKFIPLFPLFGFIFLGIFGKNIKSEKLVGWIGSILVLIPFIMSVMIFSELLGSKLKEPIIVPFFTWIATGNLDISISYQIDQLSILFALVITGVGFLIHVYSIGYMHGDRNFWKFFSYLNLFIFMMLNLVLASNFLLTFLGWEGVGLASYLLIGFWYDRKFPGVRLKWTGDAGNKAFIVNRIGDFGFLIAIFLIFTTFGTLSYADVASQAASNASNYYNAGIITAITILIFIGCTGKSAQLPLAVWLPDAMAGPTSVSALIHAATMVTAGVFIVARNSVIFALSPTTMTVVAVVGVITALVAASIGLVQNDIKKVLAYSTVSQLGFMFAALGVGAFYIGIFHVITHAFFKGLLFLGSGSVIHGMHEEQDIKNMGGLKKYMPTTHWTFLVGTLAIAGIPFFSGFFSKDEILWYAFSSPIGGWGYWLMLALSALFTSFYMFRLYYLTFQGKPRFNAEKVHPHESPKTVLFALVVLAILSTFGGFINIPKPLLPSMEHPNWLYGWLKPIFYDAVHIIEHNAGDFVHMDHHIPMVVYVLMIVATVVAFIMWLVARNWYIKDEDWSSPRNLATNYTSVYKLLLNKYYLDELYFASVIDPIVNGSRKVLWKIFDVKIIDGFVNGLAKATTKAGSAVRQLQTGVVQNYGLLMFAGIIFILALLLT